MAQVYKVTSYHVPVFDTSIAAMIRNLRKYCPGHQPVWTLIGPAKLAFPEMKVEIQVEAHAATAAAK
jgi:enamine deaminase RidA (YjgF/YER057c/UK114 family)